MERMFALLKVCGQSTRGQKTLKEEGRGDGERQKEELETAGKNA